jgi:hypothetical protein
MTRNFASLAGLAVIPLLFMPSIAFAETAGRAATTSTAPGGASLNVHPSSDASAAQQMMDAKGLTHGRYCWRGMSGHMHCRAHY